MSPHGNTAIEPGEVARQLEALARAEAEIPSADAVYWRARVRLAIDETNQRRSEVSKPVRLFQRWIGVGAIGLAALGSLWPLFLPASTVAVPLAAPFLLAAAAGLYFLTEAAT